MNEIICPDCKKVFKIDEASYAEILKQVHNNEFRNEINSRLEQANKEKNFEIAKTKNDAEIKFEKFKTIKDGEIGSDSIN